MSLHSIFVRFFCVFYSRVLTFPKRKGYSSPWSSWQLLEKYNVFPLKMDVRLEERDCADAVQCTVT